MHWRRLTSSSVRPALLQGGLLCVAASDGVDLCSRPIATSSACMRHAVSSLGCSSQMKKEREKGETTAGGGPRRDGPGGGGGARRDGAGRKARPAAGGGGNGSRKRPPPAEDSSDEGEEEDEDEAMQDAVSGSEDRFTDADE